MDQLKTFFKLVLGKNTGYACIALLSMSKRFSENYFNYPNDLDSMVDFVTNNSNNNNVYFCPQLFTDKHRIKDSVSITPCVYADLDGCSPEVLKLDPSMVIESSPGRYQAYWFLTDNTTSPYIVEEANKRLAYGHKDDGCDTSGWDLTQLLRVPYTYNFKYNSSLTIPIVAIKEVSGVRYPIKSFDIYPKVEKFDSILSEPMPETALNGTELILRYKAMLPTKAWDYWSQEPIGSWSHALWVLETMLCEAGLPLEEVLAICWESKCNKYARDNRPKQHMWAEILKAKVHTTSNLSEVRDLQKDSSLLTDDEREIVKKLPDTFVDKYIKWASSLTDSARQYHQAGAFTILSAICSGSTTLPTSFGNMYANLWFMILADTTVTRKSTAMDIAIELLDEVMPDAVMATDGSVEGLMQSMAERTGKSSIFLRDEFSGLLESMFKKDYMAGTAEMLTKLYDGKRQKRVLKKDSTDIKDPRLIIFGGGIKTKVTALLKDEHVSSGFMPRFVFITAISDITKIRPVGPPTKRVVNGRASLLSSMNILHNKHNNMRPLIINGMPQPVMTKPKITVELTDEAWERYNILERTLVKYGVESNRPDIFTPVGDRLSKSILKAAMLLACEREKENQSETVTVTVNDLLVAIKYGESWIKYSYEVISNVGQTEEERILHKIQDYVVTSPGGASRSSIMKNHKLTARDFRQIIDTMMQRGMVKQVAVGGDVRYTKV